ncbi:MULTISPECIES: TonB-dependent receptor [Halorhodospira]|uniref:TonB-dependent receptor n=1 Tax=Halorhodospira TaxID=85108 RepID=UPI001EE98393|nr:MULTISPECIES: TonB-dependent receptor [Halorhodospira]MCG5528759.1 TonB-dependent receptor [Halorhodospira halophila]MCG5543330.1 TonB-dependent receptor [Halorhodospira sp. 9628]
MILRFRTLAVSWRGALPAAGLAGLAAPAAVLGDSGAEVLPPVTVTGDPLGSRTESELVRPISVAEGEALERRRGGGTIGEVLDGLPGISNADFGPGVGRPTIRGLQGSRVEELQDGMRISDVSDEGVDHAVGGDSRRAQSVEFIRGPATLVYGSGAAGGAVNMVTSRFDPFIGDQVSGRLYGAYTDNANKRQGYAGVEVPLTEGFALRTDYSLSRSDDADIAGFQLEEGRDGDHLIRDTLVNSDVKDDSWSLTGMWSEDWGYIGVGYDRWEIEYGVPEAFFPVHNTGDIDLSDEYERIYAEHDRFDLRSEFYDPFDGFSAARFNLSYTEFVQDEIEYEYDTSTGRLDERELEATFEQDELDARLELTHDPLDALGGLRGTVGIDFHDVDYVGADPREGRDDLIRPNETTSTGVFVVEELPTGFGAVEFGARLNHERSRPADVADQQIKKVAEDGSINGVDVPERNFQEELGSRTFTTGSASAGARFELDDAHRLRTSVTYAERAPSAEQLYAFGRHGAAGTWEVGDPDLGEEQYLNLDIALERHQGAVRYDAAVFYNRVDDYIYFQSFDDNGEPLRVGADDDEVVQEDGGDQLVYNTAADVHLYGLEFEAEHDLTVADWPVTARASGDYLRGRFRDGGSLPRMTAPRLGIGVDTAWRTLDFAVDWRHVFRQTDTGPAETETGSYNLVGFDIGWEPQDVEELRVFFRGRNLLDEDGRRHESFFKGSAPILGRNYTLGASYNF